MFATGLTVDAPQEGGPVAVRCPPFVAGPSPAPTRGLGPRNAVAAPLLRWLEARVRREAGDEAGVRCYRLEAGG